MTLLFINNNLTTFYILLKWGVILEWQDKKYQWHVFHESHGICDKIIKIRFFGALETKVLQYRFVCVYLLKKKKRLNLGLKNASRYFYLILALLLLTLWLQRSPKTWKRSYFGSVVEIKHWPKATQGRKRGFISSYKLQSVITRENQDRNWRQEPQGGRNWSKTIEECSCLLATLVLQARPLYLGKSVPTVGWALR